MTRFEQVRENGIWPDELGFLKPFRPDLSFAVDGEPVEVRLRFRGNDATKQRAVVRALRDLIGKSLPVEVSDDDERIAAIETELLLLRERTERILLEVQRLRGR